LVKYSRRRFIRAAALFVGGLPLAAKAVTARAMPQGSLNSAPSRLAGAPQLSLPARIIATGIAGAGAIGSVGRFLPGGPIHDNAAFAAYTQSGRILDPERILVGSSSNFGAPIANTAQAAGSLVSIDPNGRAILQIPAGFAAAGGQASALDGRVQMFSAQSPAFLNGVNNPGAATASMAGVSAPRGLSINNAFGRIWPSNVPSALGAPSSESILDPNGLPLASPPSPLVGGVFAGDLTNRLPQQLEEGALNSAALGTAFLGRSPDGSTRAVFIAVLAGGSIIQMHTEHGLDGLAPPGTITPLAGVGGATDLRYGTVLNFEPVRILYVSDPTANAITALALTDDRRIFQVGDTRTIQSPLFNQPIGLAPAQRETEDLDWASNTTLFEGSDLYVANRGDGSIVRISQDGAVIAAGPVVLPDGTALGGGQLSGIAISIDGSRIWVTYDGSLPGADAAGGVLELEAFGS
jgi:hypothetical protein